MNISYPNKLRLIIMLVLATGLLLATLSSCSSSKYGCGHGNPRMTWNKMVRSINRP